MDSLTSEQAVLGAAITDPQGLAELLIHVQPQDQLFAERNQLIFNALSEMFNVSVAVDTLSVAAHLESKGLLEKVGGRAYLAEVATSAVPISNMRTHINMIRDNRAKNVLLNLSLEVGKMCGDGSAVTDIIEKIEASVFSVATVDQSVRPISVASLLPDTLEDIQASLAGTKKRAWESGLKELDERCIWEGGDLVILGGRPSMGKSALAMDIAEKGTASTGKPALFFTLEMSQKQLMRRLVCGVSDVPYWKINKRLLSHDEEDRLYQCAAKIENKNIWLVDKPFMSIGQLRAISRRAMMAREYGLIIVDYLQLLSAGKWFQSDNSRVAYISRSLKGIAKELNVPMLVLCQLNRAGERENKEPKLINLRDSGAIEQDADVVIFIHRKTRAATDAKLIIAKQRQGPADWVVPCYFDPETTTFRNLEKNRDDSINRFIEREKGSEDHTEASTTVGDI